MSLCGKIDKVSSLCYIKTMNHNGHAHSFEQFPAAEAATAELAAHHAGSSVEATWDADSLLGKPDAEAHDGREGLEEALEAHPDTIRYPQPRRTTPDISQHR